MNLTEISNLGVNSKLGNDVNTIAQNYLDSIEKEIEVNNKSNLAREQQTQLIEQRNNLDAEIQKLKEQEKSLQEMYIKLRQIDVVDKYNSLVGTLENNKVKLLDILKKVEELKIE